MSYIANPASRLPGVTADSELSAAGDADQEVKAGRHFGEDSKELGKLK